MHKKQEEIPVDITPAINLIGDYTDAKVAPTLAALGFITSALQLFISSAIGIGNSRGQELGKAGGIASVFGLAPQAIDAVHASSGS
jgi:hypothetical protein